MEALLTVKEAAARLRVSDRTVFTWLRSGQLRGLKAGRKWRIPAAEVQAFLERSAGLIAQRSAIDIINEELDQTDRQ
jgi:excisionase family DNA binding protein